MTILILSLGGGGGNILRSVKALFRRDLAAVQQTDPRYAERLRRSVVTRFLDTNEFSTSDVPAEERVIIGATTTRRLGSRHDPEVARHALDESRADVEALLEPHPVVILIGTGGKGTGAGTILPIAQMARQARKLVIPIFVRPSFEWHEVEKRRYDHSLMISKQFDTAGIRLIEILNDRGYSSADPQPQTRVWERMNRPIARGLRGLLYVLSDLSQVDPSDLSMLFAGAGRLRIGFAEIEPPDGGEPTEDQIQKAVTVCWSNPYSVFSKPVGTSLVCIQGQWSNVVDGRLKGGLAALATAGGGDATYNPLHAFAPDAPKPWGMTGLFAEYTGNHPPLEIAWPDVRTVRPVSAVSAVGISSRTAAGIDLDDDGLPMPAAPGEPGQRSSPAMEVPVPSMPDGREIAIDDRSFATLWDLALAVNRGDKTARAIAADGETCDIPFEASEVRRLVGTVWFRSVFPHLSPRWRDRLLDVLLDDVTIHNHVVGEGRRATRLSRMPFEELKRAAIDVLVTDVVRTDVHFLVTIGQLWGPEALGRIKFEPEEQPTTSRLETLLQTFRH
jgi:cell division GTPase FtsZ